MNNELFDCVRSVKLVLPLLFLLGMSDGRAFQDELPEQSILQELPVVLSAARLRQPLADAPNAVTVIDRAIIRASGFRTIADLFRLVPGMYVDYQSGHESIVGYHGETDAYSRRMQVLIDGRSVYMPPYSIVDWGGLPLDVFDIERIEVVRGPAATSFGSNSTMGVINIISRDASAQHGVEASVTRGNAGNAEISDATVRLGRHGEHLDYRLTLGMRSDNGFDYPADTSAAFDGYNDSNATHYVNLRGNYSLGARDSLDAQVGFSNSVRVTGNTASELFQPRNAEIGSGYQQLIWLHALGQYDDIQLQYSHSARRVKDEIMTGPIAGTSYPINENLMAHRHEMELQHRFRINPASRIVWGAALRYDATDAPFLFSTPKGVHQARLFAHSEWRPSQPVLLNTGAMLEDDGMGNTKISPRIALNYQVTPAHTIRTGISVAYRNPALGEEYSNYRHTPGGYLYQSWLSSGGLHPERAVSREIGYVGNLGSDWAIDARIYDDKISNVIWVHGLFDVPANINDRAWDFRNELNAHYTGAEATVKYRSGANHLTVNYAHQLASVEVLGNTNINQLIPALVNDFQRTVPRDSGSLLFSHRITMRWSFSLGYYEQTPVEVLDGIYPQPWTRRVDLRVAMHFAKDPAHSPARGGELALVMQNALQDHIVGYSGYNLDRRAYLTATIDF